MVAAIVRVTPVAVSDFPLNDGGLFWTMAGDLRANGFVPPLFTSYNGGAIPFAYPPIGIYLAALFSTLDGTGGFLYPTWAPAIWSVLAVPLVYVLAHGATRSHLTAAFAACGFALMPAAYQWMILGGGVTRAVGMVFALLAVISSCRSRVRSHRGWALGAAVFGGLAVMSHPNAGLAAVVGIVAMRLDRDRPSSIAAAGAIVAGILAVSSPWWLTIMLRYGPDTLLYAASLGGPLDSITSATQRLMTWTVSGEFFFPWVGALGLAGLVLDLMHRRWRLPAWFLLQTLVDYRLGITFSCIPLALMAGQAASTAVLAATSSATMTDPRECDLADVIRSSRMMRWFLPLAITTMVISVIWSYPAPDFAWRAIAPANRADMTWVQQNVPSGARFAVVSGDAWGNEGTDEWFPAITNSVSVATPQGTEWTGRGRWREMFDAHAELQACASQDLACLDRWSVSTGISFEYVYVPKGNPRASSSPDDCCATLRASMSASARARLIHDGHGASIWAFQPRP